MSVQHTFLRGFNIPVTIQGWSRRTGPFINAFRRPKSTETLDDGRHIDINVSSYSGRQQACSQVTGVGDMASASEVKSIYTKDNWSVLKIPLRSEQNAFQARVNQAKKQHILQQSNSLDKGWCREAFGGEALTTDAVRRVSRSDICEDIARCRNSYREMLGQGSNTMRSPKSGDIPTQRKRVPWQYQKEALSQKFGSTGWQPRKRLSPDALDGVRALHAQEPNKYTTPVLAHHFQISPEAIRRILKSKWMPNDDEDAKRRERWNKRGRSIWFRRSQLGIRPPKKWRNVGGV